ncbi:hypothetical protein PoB_002009800 [Plakobranchus ocellatus]|uniref:H-type lectin domain-containing protein n=1 Tax=Plakobranchus ocellatus TaxID=259542 RepID=A0AAV3ZGL5_9GAST|nr:hypothetical protein PoB_002009800 [Plakobranchus ocellatus]
MVSYLYVGPLLLCLGLIGAAKGQFFHPLLFGTEFGEQMLDFYGSPPGSYLVPANFGGLVIQESTLKSAGYAANRQCSNLTGALNLRAYDFLKGARSCLLSPPVLLNQLTSRLNNLEINIRSGAIGGCESGVVGPLSPLQSSATITFRGNFLTPPTVSLSLSDLTTADATNPVSFQIRPSSVTTSSAVVTFTDLGTPNNVASAFVSYMVCPSNSSPMVGAGSSSGSSGSNTHHHNNNGMMG